MDWKSLFFEKPEQRSVSTSLRDVSVSDRNAFGLLFDGAKSFAGESVTIETALSVPSVWTAINVIAGTIAALPLDLYKSTPEGNVKATSDPLYRVLHDQVNADYLTSYAWLKQVLVSYLTKGRSFTFIERNGIGKVSNLWPLDTGGMTVEVNGWRRVYHYADANGTREFQSGEIIDLVWMQGCDATQHRDPLYVHRNAIGLAIAAERYASSIFENGGVPPYVLESPPMSPAAAERASEQVGASIKRAREQKRGVLVLPEGNTLKPIGFDPDKTQLLGLRQFAIIEVARIFNIPPTFLMDLTNGTYSNTEQLDLFFTKHTLTPILRLIEQELNVKLFSDRNRSNYVAFDLDDLLRGDSSRIANYAAGVAAGIFMPNEVRDRDNLPPVKGGDRAYRQGALVPLDSDGFTDPAATVAEPIQADDQGELPK